MEEQYLTLKDLQKKTNAPAYLIQYLKNCNRLPIAQSSQGRGYPTFYRPEAVGVIEVYPFRTYGTKRVNLLRETFC